MSPFEVRRATAAKMARGGPQQPLDGVETKFPGIPPSAAAKLRAIKARCEANREARQAVEDGFVDETQLDRIPLHQRTTR